MPFSLIPQESSLPKQTRRSWLRRTVAGVAALSLGRFSRTEAAPEGQPWVAFVSDTHIAADPARTSRNNNMTNNLKAVVAEILAEPTRPQAVLIDGDLALANGQKGDYEQILKLLAPLVDAGVPIHLALGNHDNRENFRQVLAESPILKNRKATSIESHHTTDVTIAGVRFIVLDSLQKPDYTPGALGEGQRTWLKETLDQQKETPTVIFVHHDPSLEMKRSLEDTPELYEIIAPRPQVKALVFGHTHVWNPGLEYQGIKLINIPAVAYNFTPPQPQGWAKFVPLQGGATLTLSALDKEHQSNGRPLLLNWR